MQTFGATKSIYDENSQGFNQNFPPQFTNGALDSRNSWNNSTNNTSGIRTEPNESSFLQEITNRSNNVNEEKDVSLPTKSELIHKSNQGKFPQVVEKVSHSPDHRKENKSPNYADFASKYLGESPKQGYQKQDFDDIFKGSGKKSSSKKQDRVERSLFNDGAKSDMGLGLSSQDSENQNPKAGNSKNTDEQPIKSSGQYNFDDEPIKPKQQVNLNCYL